MTTTSIDVVAALAPAMVEAAVAQLTTALGPSVEVGDATVTDALDAQAFAAAPPTRNTFEGIDGAILTIAQPTGDDATDTAVGESLIAGALAAIAAGSGTAAVLAGSEPIAIATIEPSPAAVVTCELTTIAGSPFKVAWVVEAALGNALQGGAPVAPPASAPSAAPTLPELGRGQSARPGGPGMDVLADVPMDVTVELGRTVMQVRDLLALGPGSVVELDRLAGAPVDVLVNGTAVATGNVVVVDNELAVRIIDIIER